VSITKRAFIQGLQRSLLNAGAIPPYTSKWQAKHALDQAEEKLEKKEDKKKEEAEDNNLPEKEPREPEEMSEEEIAETMTDIVEAEPLDEAIEALQEYQETAGDSEEASEDLAEALKDVKDSKEAAWAIRRLKVSNSVGSGAVGNEMIGKGVGNLEHGLGAAPQMPKGLRVDQLEPHAHVGPNVDGSNVGVISSQIKDKTTKREVTAALNILRKLAGEDGSGDELGGKGLGNLQDGYPNPPPSTDKVMEMLETEMAVIPAAGLTNPGTEVLAHLVQKTAQEVGHFLPQGLSSSDKLAALRTMVGMNGQERAAYIGRIKQAMYDPHQSQSNPDAQAAQVLRNLGL
jgi:hypothetical protein